MENFDWRIFLSQHSIFSGLKTEEIEEFLKNGVLQEKDYSPGSVILEEGERGDSVFLIGSGSVQVVLPGEEGGEIPLSTLRKGEFFGEMAAFERGQPRAATVRVREKCTLLEVKGQEFCQLINKHADIGFEVLSKRLREANERMVQVLEAKMKEVDQKLDLLNTKFDAKFEAVDASLQAAQTVFDETKTRTNEVINSAERSRTRLTNVATVIGGVITTAALIFGGLGISKLQNITEIEGDVRKKAEEAIKHVDSIGEKAEVVDKLNEVLPIMVEVARDAVLSLFHQALKEKNESNAIALSEQLLKLDPTLTGRLLGEIETQIAPGKDLEIYKELLKTILKDINTPREKITAYYLYLTTLILDNKKEEFKEKFDLFQKYAEEHKDQRVKETLDFSLLDALFREQQDPAEQDLFQEVKRLIP